MATSKFLSYAGLEELINNRLGIDLGGELATTGADIILKSKNKNLASITIPLAGTLADDNTTRLPGLFTNAEKTKLSGIATGAEVNQNAFSNVKITNNAGGTTALTVTSNVKTDTLNLTAGTNIKITGNDSSNTITIDNTYVYNHPEHAGISISDVNATPKFGEAFNALGTLTSNNQGHITAASFKTVTIPSLPNVTVTDKGNTAAANAGNTTVEVVKTVANGTTASSTQVFLDFTTVEVPTKTYVDNEIANVVATSQAIVLKGSVSNLGSSVKLSKGDAFVCDSAGATINGQALEIGDVIIWNGADDTTYASTLTNWIYLQKNVDIATDSTPGLIKIAAKRTTTPSITTGGTTANRYYGVELDKNNKAFVNVPWNDTTYTAEKGITLTNKAFGHTNSANGTHTKVETASVTANGGKFTVAQYEYDEYGHITDSYNKTITVNNGYTLPIAKYNTLGGLKPLKSYTVAATLGTTATTSQTAVSVNAITNTTGRYYAIEVDKNGIPFVNVPWTDGKGVTSVTITQGEGITVSNSGTAITETGTRTITLNAATTEKLGGIKVSAANVAGATIDANRFGVKTTASNVAYVEILEISTSDIDSLFA